MRTILILLFILVSLTISGDSPQAADGPESQPVVSPMMQEIKATLAQEATALQALQRDLTNAPTERDALAVLRAISRHKQDTEVAVLGIQVRYARQAGHEDAAIRMEQAIQRILDPEPVEPDPEVVREMEARRAAERNRD